MSTESVQVNFSPTLALLPGSAPTDIDFHGSEFQARLNTESGNGQPFQTLEADAPKIQGTTVASIREMDFRSSDFRSLIGGKFAIQGQSIDSLEPGLSNKIQKSLDVKLSKQQARILSFDTLSFQGSRLQGLAGAVYPQLVDIPGNHQATTLLFAAIDPDTINLLADDLGVNRREHTKAVAVNEVSAKLILALNQNITRQDLELLNEYVTLYTSKDFWLASLSKALVKNIGTGSEYDKIAASVQKSLKQTATQFGIGQYAYLNNFLPDMTNTYIYPGNTRLGQIKGVLNKYNINADSFISNLKSNMLKNMEVDTRSMRAALQE